MSSDIIENKHRPGKPAETAAVTPRYAWVILAIAFLAAICATSLMDRVAPVIPDLVNEFDIGLSGSGLLMSVFGLTGLALTLPAGLILQRLGIRKVSSIAFGLMIAGVLTGALSRSFGLLLFSRMLEGMGNVMIFIIAPAMITMWFPPEKRGLPLGIWAMSTPMGNMVIWLVIPRLTGSMGWRGAWWVSALATVLVFITFRLLFRSAPAETQSAGGDFSALKSLMRSKSIWLVGFAWFLWIGVQQSMYTFYPTYLTEEVGYTMIRAGALFSMINIIRMVNNPLVGWFSDVIGSRKVLLVAAAAIYLPIYVMLFRSSPGMIPVLMALMGFFTSIVPIMILAAVPDAAGDPALTPMGMAIVQFGFNLSLIVAPPIFGGLAESVGWSTASLIFTPLILLTIISILFNKRVR